MANLEKRENRSPEPLDVLDRMFEDWSRWLPFRRAWMLGPAALRDEMIRVDEFQEEQTLVVRAELPGIDPEKDVEITVSGGMLHIEAERREEQKVDETGYRRRELRYGSVSRTLQLPPGVKESDVSASYKDGILEIRIPTTKGSATRVPVEKG